MTFSAVKSLTSQSVARGTAKEFVEAYKTNYAKTDGKGLICIPSGNHDMDRLARTLDTDEMRVAFAFLLTMPGAPFIYYGDEIGMRYVEDLTSVEGGYGRTGSRSPPCSGTRGLMQASHQLRLKCSMYRWTAVRTDLTLKANPRTAPHLEAKSKGL